MCHNYKSLVKCADHIDFLKAFGFGEKCHCSGPSFNQLKVSVFKFDAYTLDSIKKNLISFSVPC